MESTLWLGWPCSRGPLHRTMGAGSGWGLEQRTKQGRRTEIINELLISVYILYSYCRYLISPACMPALGAVFGASWLCGLMAAGTWLVVLAIGRYSSLSALVTFATVPLYIWLTSHSALLTAAFASISAMLYWRHSANIQRLLKGEEPKVGKKK